MSHELYKEEVELTGQTHTRKDLRTILMNDVDKPNKQAGTAELLPRSSPRLGPDPDNTLLIIDNY